MAHPIGYSISVSDLAAFHRNEPKNSRIKQDHLRYQQLVRISPLTFDLNQVIYSYFRNGVHCPDLIRSQHLFHIFEDCSFFSLRMQQIICSYLEKDGCETVSRSECIRPLPFNCLREVCVVGDYVIGVRRYNEKTSIMAYDTRNQRWQWEIILEDREDRLIHFSKSAFGLVLMYAGNQQVDILNPKTGMLAYSITLPILPISTWDQICIAPNGFCYFLVNMKGSTQLIGGDYRSGDWRTVFTKEAPSNSLCSLGNIMGFQSPSQASFAIVTQKGDTYAFQNYHEKFFCYNGKIYAVEQVENFSKIQVFSESDFVLESELIVEDGNMELKGIWENGSVVGSFSKEGQELFFFTDPKLENLSLFNRPIPTCCKAFFVDQKRKTLWTLEFNYEIWKHSKEESCRICVLDASSLVTNIVHVDEEGLLYFTHP